MATKTKAPTAAPPAYDDGGTAVTDAPPTPAPAAAPAHPPITDYEQLWVFHEGVALANNQVGFIWALKTDAATMIAAGDAVSAYTNPLPYITKKPPPAPVVVAITAFSAANPTIATASAGDLAKLANGDALKLSGAAGDPAAVAAVNGKTGTVANKGGINFDLTGVDLSAATVAGLTATGTKQ
jgi:hypothetical protein